MMNSNWFKDSKYGLFIHWGLYASLGGIYQERVIPFAGTEWIMRTAKIPYEEYSKLADTFNPNNFDAKDIVTKAKKWGMKYLVFTAKHHDGFAMYDSKVSDYTCVKSPFGRDPLKELADECKEQGIILGIYYSQMQDWEDENGWGNEWDFKPNAEKDFEKYFNNKVKPQVKELLTNYGEVGLVWFDTPYTMPIELCEELRDYVKSIQPDCLVNGRIGYRLGDYRQMGDNQIPVLSFPGKWETPMTMNHTWGFSKVDENWKTSGDVISKLVDVVGKGGNLLLNIGPDENGNVPEPCVKALDGVGEWLETNGDSIYNCNETIDFQYVTPWGKVTGKDGRMFLHILKFPDFPFEVFITGIKPRINKVYLLDTKEDLRYEQSYEQARDEFRFRFALPESRKAETGLIVCAEYEGEMEIQVLQ